MKDNLFNYAKGELSGSAFWAWVLSALTDNESQSTARFELAKKFAEKIDLDSDNIKQVHTEVRLPKMDGKSGNADIVLYAKPDAKKTAHDDIVALIENKTWTSSAQSLYAQIKRYHDSISGSSAQAKAIVMTFRYDTKRAWAKLEQETTNIIFLGLSEQHELLHNFKNTSNLIIAQYAAFIANIHTDRKARLAIIQPESKISELAKAMDHRYGQCKQMAEINEPPNILNHHDAQWKLMTKITHDCDSVRIYNGTSSGRPWTQAGWGRDKEPRFFYRFDKDNKGYYLRLNHYLFDKPKDKDEIRMKAFHRCTDIISKHTDLDVFEYRAKLPYYPNAKESTFWYFRINEESELTLRELANSLTKFHRLFTSEMQ